MPYFHEFSSRSQLLGTDAFELQRHAWQVAVQLRCLELLSGKWLHGARCPLDER